MELYPLDDVVPVPDAHNYAVISLGSQCQWRRESVPFYYQGVVTASLEGIGQVSIYRPAVMINQGALAMSRHGGADNLTAIDIADTLVPQTDTKDGGSPGKVPDNIIGDTRLKWSTGARGDDNVRWAQVLNLRQGYLVITVDHRLPAQFTQILGKVIDKGIVVIDYYDHI